MDDVLLFILSAAAAAPRWAICRIRPINIDEAFQLLVASRPTLSDVFRAMKEMGPAQFPLDYILAYSATRFTHDITILRFLPLAWAVATVIVAYILGKRLWNRTFAWCWGLLIAASVLHMESSFTFRPYSLIVFLSLASTWLFVEALGRPSWSWAYGIATLAYHFLTPYAICKSAIELACVYASKIRSADKRRFYGLILGTWLAAGAWFAVHSLGIFHEQVYGAGTKDIFSIYTAAYLFMEYGQYSSRVAVAYFGLFFAGIAISLKKPPLKRYAVYGLAVFAAICAAILVSHLMSHLFLWPRHTIELLPFFLGFVAVALSELMAALYSEWPQARKYAHIIAAGASLAVFSTIAVSFLAYRRESLNTLSDIKNKAEFVHSVVGPNDVIVMNNPNSGATFLYYYDRDAFFRLDGIGLSAGVAMLKFPPGLEASSGGFRNRFLVLCRADKNFATVTPESLAKLRESLIAAGAKFYFVNLPMNFYPDRSAFNAAFAALGENDTYLALMKGVLSVAPQKAR